MMNSRDIARYLALLAQDETREDLILKFISFLKERGYSHLFPQIREHLEFFKDYAKGQVIVETAFPLNEDELKDFRSLFHTEKLREQVDRRKIGGAEFLKDGVMYRSSIQDRIDLLKKRLQSSNSERL